MVLDLPPNLKCVDTLQHYVDKIACLIVRDSVDPNTALRTTLYEIVFTPCLKTVQTYFLSELCQISTDCENFWHRDSKENKLF